MVIFRPWTFVGCDATGARFRLDTAKLCSLALDQMLEAVTYRAAGSGRQILVPLQWRYLFGV